MLPLDIFLTKFPYDVQLLQDSILSKGVTVILGPFICDAPMRSTDKGIVSHSGYHSCERCTQKGQYHDRTVVFPSCEAELRNDDSFH